MPVLRWRLRMQGICALWIADILVLALCCSGCGTPVPADSSSSPRPLRTYENQAFGFEISYDGSVYRAQEVGGEEGEEPSGGASNPSALSLELVSSEQDSVTVQALALPEPDEGSAAGAWGEDQARLVKRKSMYFPPELGFESTAHWGKLNGMKVAVYEGENERVHQVIYEILDTNTVDHGGDTWTVEYLIVLSSAVDDWLTVADGLRAVASTFAMLGGSPGQDE